MQPKCLILPLVLANACLLQLSYARAEVQVSGSKEVVVIEAKRASLGEVIAALNSVLKMHIYVKPEIQNLFNGHYSGTLPQVLRRMLQGYDYVFWDRGGRQLLSIITPNTFTNASSSSAVLKAHAENGKTSFSDPEAVASPNPPFFFTVPPPNLKPTK